MDVGAPPGQARPAWLFDGKTALQHDAAVWVLADRVLIEPCGGGTSQEWPLSGLMVQAARDGVMTFRHRREPARLLVADPALLQALRRHVRHWPGRPAGWPAALAACLAVAVMGLLLVVAAPELLTPLVSPGWEAALGERAQAAVLAQHPACKGVAGQRALNTLVTRLATAGRITAPVQVAVSNDALVNAFTFPGGRVVVMRGLIATVADGGELAGVLAHELGHVAHRDPTRQLVRQLGISVVGVGFGWGGWDSGGLASALLGLSYGRAAESSADGFAVAALKAAGLRADGLGRFFAHMDTGDVPAFPFLSDHPPPLEREQRVKQPPDGVEPFDGAQWQAIRAMCGT